MTKDFTRFRVTLSSNIRCRFLRITFRFVMGLINLTRTQIMRHRRRTFSFRNEIRLKLSSFGNVRRFTSTFRYGVFHLCKSSCQVNNDRYISHGRAREQKAICRSVVGLVLRQDRCFFRCLFTIFRVRRLCFNACRVSIKKSCLRYICLHIVGNLTCIYAIGGTLMSDAFQPLSIRARS